MSGSRTARNRLVSGSEQGAQQQPQDRIDGSVRTRDLGSEGSRSACAGPDTPPAPAYTRPRFPDLVVHSEALFGRSAFSAYLAPPHELGLWPLGVVLVFELLSGFLAIECPIDRDAISVGSPVPGAGF